MIPKAKGSTQTWIKSATTPRPVYETAADLKNEKKVADFVSKKLSCRLVKLPFKYQMDYGVLSIGVDDKEYITGMIEIKCRKIPKDKYDTYMISAKKVLTMLQYMEKFNLNMKLVVRWTDVIGSYTFKDNTSYNIGYSGRFGRGDSQDVEPVVYIPIKNFDIL